MSETRTPASISGPRRRQAFQDGELPESRKRCVVEMEESTNEPAGVAVVAVPAMPGTREIILRVDDASVLFAGEARQEDGSTVTCEMLISGERYGATAVTPDTLDGQPVLRVTPVPLTARGRRLNIVLPDRLAVLAAVLDEGQAVEIEWRRTSVEYFGTFICVPGGSVAYQRKRERLESTWRRDNSFPLFIDGERNPLPQSTREALDLEAEVGTSVIDFEDFVDDAGPIQNRLPDGKLNEAALLALLQIRAFHAALTAFYQGDAFDLAQQLALEKKASRPSSGTLSTPAQSSDSLPS